MYHCNNSMYNSAVVGLLLTCNDQKLVPLFLPLLCFLYLSPSLRLFNVTSVHMDTPDLRQKIRKVYSSSIIFNLIKFIMHMLVSLLTDTIYNVLDIRNLL